jgi:hypothetical protein
MPDHQRDRAVARAVHSRTDLPRPLGLEIRRGGDVTVYLPDLPAFEAWRGVLDRGGDPAEADGWRYCAGWLADRNHQGQMPATLMVRLDHEGTDR